MYTTQEVQTTNETTGVIHLFTTGYEGENIDQWIEKLKQARVTVLIDIRERALSRKKGFSKTKLKQQLEKNHISYIHFKNLGSPSQMRKKLMRDKDYITFFDEYNSYLDQQEQTLFDLFPTLENETACLMCFEKNHRRCHRSAVVERLKEIYIGKLRVDHL